MPSARNVTRTTLIVAAIGLTTALQTQINAIRNAAPTPADYQGTSILTENLHFVTAANPYPAIYVNSAPKLTYAGSNFVQSGSTAPIYGALTLAEVAGAASGTLSIQNPYPFDVVCRDAIIDVTTSPTAATYLDIGTASGAVASGQNKCLGLAKCGSGTNITDNLILAAGSATGTYTLSGSALNNIIANNTGLGSTGSYLYPQSFKLNAADGATDYINIVATGTQSGETLAGSYNFDCRRLQ